MKKSYGSPALKYQFNLNIINHLFNCYKIKIVII